MRDRTKRVLSAIAVAGPMLAAQEVFAQEDPSDLLLTSVTNNVPGRVLAQSRIKRDTGVSISGYFCELVPPDDIFDLFTNAPLVQETHGPFFDPMAFPDEPPLHRYVFGP